MAKPTPERLALAQAHQQRTAAQAALAEAEDAHRLADRDFHGAQIAVSDIEAEIGRAKATRTYGLPNLIEQVNEQLLIAYSKKDTAGRAVAPFGIAAREAKARLDAAQYPAHGTQTRVAHAATAVARSEAEPIAREHLARVQAAFATILTYGPDLIALADKQLLAPELAREVETAAGALLRRATAWPEFAAACRASPWRSAQQQLEQDHAATLPASAPEHSR